MGNINSWLNINPTSGTSGETSLSLTALSNSSLYEKTATITAKNDTYNVSDTTTVKIRGFQPTLTLSRSTLRFDSTGGTATFTVYSNTAWTINFPALVHSYSTSAGTGDTEVSVVVSQNLDEVGKVDTGIVKDVYNVNQLYLTIVQDSFITELTVTPDDDITFVNTGSSTSIIIDTNTDWVIDYPAWVTPSIISGESGTTTVTFTAGENGPTDRSGEITVYAGSKEVTINVFQPFYIPPYITVTPSSWTFNYTEDGKVFVVDSYPEWTAEIISTGETAWESDAYMEAVFDFPTAMTMPLWNGSSGSTTAIYNGPIKINGSQFVVPSAGTYILRYELANNGQTPRIQNNTYLKELRFNDGVGVIVHSAFTGCNSLSSVTIGSGMYRIGEAAFSGCSALNEITITAPTAPVINSNTFKSVATGGTLHYPAGSDYSVWLSTEESYLGYYFWNNLSPTLYFLYTVTYNVTTTGNTQILESNGGGPLDYPTTVNFVRDSQGNIKELGQGNVYYQFSSTGSQRLDLSVVAGHWVSLRNMTNVLSIQVNDVEIPSGGTLDVSACTFTGLTLYRDPVFTGATASLRRIIITGNTSTVPALEYHQLRSAVIDGNVTQIPARAFYGSTYLSSVTLSDKVTVLRSNCFVNTALQSITIPSGVTALSEYALAHNDYLESITSLRTTAPSISNTAFYDVKTGGTLHYPAGSDYSSWLSTGNYYLGKYGWTGQEL